MEKQSHNSLQNINEQNFIAFYNQWYASLCYFANRYINDPLIAEDIVGDVALKVWEKRGELRHEGALKSYFYTGLRNACLDWLAKEKTREKRDKLYVRSVQSEEAPIIERIIETETMRRLELAIDTLPHQCRTVFIKLFKEGKSLSEAADEMGLSIFSIKAQRQRGIKLLRERLVGICLILSLFTYFF